MKRRIELTRRLLRLIYEGSFAALSLSFAQVILAKEEASLIVFPVVLFMYLLSYIAREKAPGRITLFLMHVIMGGLVFLLPFSLLMKLFTELVMVKLFGDSLIYLNNASRLITLTDLPWPSMLFCLLYYIFGVYCKSSMLVKEVFIVVLLLLIVYLVQIYFEGLRGYIDSALDTRGLPIKRVIKTNSVFVGAILVFLFVVIALAELMGIDKILISIGKSIARIAGVVIYFFSVVGKLISSLFRGGSSGVQSYADIKSQVGEEIGSDGSFFEDWIKLFLIVGIMYLLFLVIKKVIKYFLRARSFSGDLVERADTSVERNLYAKKGRGRKSKKSLEDKCRLRYKRKILTYRHEFKLTKYETALDIEGKIGELELGNIEELTRLYEALRYSDMEITNGVLKKMTELGKIN